MADLEKRSQVISLLARSAHQGNLGLFLGTGFSIAVTKGKAPTWRTLLQRIADDHGDGDPFIEVNNIGLSMAEIASRMIQSEHERLNRDKRFESLTQIERFELATSRIKEDAARIVADLNPDADIANQCRKSLDTLKPAWIVTTNYDTLFQSIHGKSRTFLPDDVIVPTHGLVPVWQIHGSALVPKSLVLSHEDYIRNLRPGTYRQSKLAHLMAESTTLMLGYSYGDVNVQTAAEIVRSKGLLEVAPSDRPGSSLIIQLVRTSSPTEQVGLGPGGSLTIEATEVVDLLDQVTAQVAKMDELAGSSHAFLERCKSDPTKLVKACIGKPENVSMLAELIRDYPAVYYDFDLIALLGHLFSEISLKAHAVGGFHYYGIWLEWILTMLLQWDLRQMPPPIFNLLAAQLADVVYYVDPDGKHVHGRSWQATDTWKKSEAELRKRKDLIAALSAYSRRSTSGYFLDRLLGDGR